MSDGTIIMLTPEQCNNVKHVIFGNQKQANVTNEAVVKLIAREIVKEEPSCQMSTEVDVMTAIQHILERWIQNGYDAVETDEETFVALVAGEVSLSILRSDGPKYVNVSQPSPDSPKYNFRIYRLGEGEPEVDMSAEMSSSRPTYTMASGSGIDVENNRQDIVAWTEELKNKIISVAPESVVHEFNNDYAAALYLYPDYMRSAD